MPEIFRILAPLDEKPESESVMPYVEQIARTLPSQVTLLRVMNPATGPEAKQALERLHELSARLIRRGTRVLGLVLPGDAADRIVQLAVLGRQHLVVLRPGRGGELRQWIQGSVARKVLPRLPMPALVLAADLPAPCKVRRILVPLDGSSRSASILETVKVLALAHGAAVQLVTVVSPGEEQDLPPRTIAANLQREMAGLRDGGVEASLAIRRGDPAAEILSCATSCRADLIALATHGRTGLNKVRHGSVAGKILREAPMPVMILRKPGVAARYPGEPLAARARNRSMEKLQRLREFDVPLSQGPYQSPGGGHTLDDYTGPWMEDRISSPRRSRRR